MESKGDMNAMQFKEWVEVNMKEVNDVIESCKEIIEKPDISLSPIEKEVKKNCREYIKDIRVIREGFNRRRASRKERMKVAAKRKVRMNPKELRLYKELQERLQDLNLSPLKTPEEMSPAAVERYRELRERQNRLNSAEGTKKRKSRRKSKKREDKKGKSKKRKGKKRKGKKRKSQRKR